MPPHDLRLHADRPGTRWVRKTPVCPPVDLHPGRPAFSRSLDPHLVGHTRVRAKGSRQHAGSAL